MSPPILAKYEDFVLHNAPQISGLESGLRSLTYLLPGRFENSDMASEAIFTFVNLMSLYHDTILSTAALRQQPETPATKFNRYTRYMLRSGSTYKRVAYTLTIVQMCEVLMEMGARRVGGRRGRERVVVGVEIAKVICRTILLKLSRNRMTMHATVPERDYDPATVEPPPTSPSEHPATWKGTRTGKEHIRVDHITKSDKGGYDHAVQYLLSKALTEAAISPMDLLRPIVTARRKVSEWMFVLRPLVYVLALRRYGPSSYKPYLLSLTMEVLSLTASLSPSTLGFRRDLTILEREQYKRRYWLLLYYLLRNPFYEQWTKERMGAFIEGASRRPLISLLAGILRDYQPLWEKWHFYTSGY
ncbi:peroxisome membrane protein [Fimicolochytrium jonesii]|uniref:peroxisome membrane protein n=1 Tax=Fimicolochytrium jonesii TaxID=1396493 RepID=UPI0022FF25F7|nr:peroxisome membrane protein [Fimicolochytrium jonesii]KAI8820131.1 peroxisome membrane protein [Fimicolochytrium jonesii]